MVTGNALSNDVISASTDLFLELGRIGKWLQALGVIVVLWIIFQLINLWLNKHRWNKLEEFEVKVNRIEGKIDRLLGKKRKS